MSRCKPCLITIGVPLPLGGFDLEFGGTLGAIRPLRPARELVELVRVSCGHNGTPGTISGLRVGTPSQPQGIVESADLSGEGPPIETCAPTDLDREPLRLSGTLNGAQTTTLNLTFRLE